MCHIDLPRLRKTIPLKIQCVYNMGFIFFSCSKKIKQLETKEFSFTRVRKSECVYAGVNECKHLDEFFSFLHSLMRFKLRWMSECFGSHLRLKKNSPDISNFPETKNDKRQLYLFHLK